MAMKDSAPNGEGRKDFFRSGMTLKGVIETGNVRGDNLASITTGILSEWHRRVIPRARAEVAKPLSDFQTSEKLGGIKVPPHIKVNLGDGVTVYIVGVTHSFNANKSKRTEYGAAIKEFVDTTAQSHGFIWAAEENLERDFDVRDTAVSLRDQQGYMNLLAEKQQDHEDVQQGKKGFRRKVKEAYHVVKTVVTDIFNAGKGPTSFQNREIVEMIRPVMTKSDTTSILLRQNVIGVTKLPEPLDMEAIMVLTNGDDTDKPSIVVDRSHIQAKELAKMIQEAKDARSRSYPAGEDLPPITLGLLTGHFHDSQIEYFLNHPDYNPHESLSAAKDLL